MAIASDQLSPAGLGRDGGKATFNAKLDWKTLRLKALIALLIQ
jgi:hypothetical protein